MNVGICVRHAQEGMEEAFAAAVAQGFNHCQLISWNPALWTAENAAQIKALSEKHGMTITAFWCGWEGPKMWNFVEGPETLGIVPPAYRARRVQNLLDGAAYAKELGVQDVVTHMGFIPENMSDPNYPGVRAAVKAVAAALKRQGQNLLFETGQETPVVLLRLFEEINTDNLFINLDPANLMMYGKANPVDALDVIGDYVRGVHAKDGLYPTNGKELGEEVKVGTGKANFPALLRGLKSHGFDGSLTIEREIDGEQQLLDIRETQKYLQELIDQL